jgi:serine/threonine-protein kinase
MAEIFEATDTRLARRVAIKILRTDLPDPRALERFEREARLAARFNHPNAVTIFDVGDDGSRPYLVMELIEGRSLAELLRERGPLEPGEAASIMGDVLLALSAAHSSGIVHRDVKPGNILIGDDGRVKLADFGIAKAMSDASAGLTAVGQIIGTPRYLAPEQMRGARATPRSDQYSAGIVLHEMLTGSIPVADETVVAAVSSRHEAERAPGSMPLLASRRPGMPTWLCEVVDRSVSFDPADRFSDVAEMRTSLTTRGSRGVPVASVPGGTGPSDRTRILETVPSIPTRPASQPAPSAVPEPSRRGKAWLVAVVALAAILSAGTAAMVWSRSAGGANGSTAATTSRPTSTSAVPTTRALSTTIATVAVPSTTAAATTVATTVTTAAVTTTVPPTATVVVLVDMSDVIDQLAVNPFSFGSSGEQLLKELRYAVELSQQPGNGQVRKAVDDTRADIVKWIAEGSLDADIGADADRALVALRR